MIGRLARLIPILLLMGVASPRLLEVVHVATAHGGTIAATCHAEGPSGPAHACCHHAPSRTPDDSRRPEPDRPDREETPEHECPTCVMLALLAATTPADVTAPPSIDAPSGHAPGRPGLAEAAGCADRPRGRGPPAA